MSIVVDYWSNVYVKGPILISGIFCSLLVYGYAQEKIMTQPWGSGQEKFDHSVFLVMCNRIMSMSIAVIAILLRSKTQLSCL